MAHPYHHAVSSARTFGGAPEDYVAIHNWFDLDSKSAWADFRHRALRHHALGIKWCEEAFGVTITNSDGKEVPVRLVAEMHVVEDCRFIPSVQDWLENMEGKPWMGRSRRLSRELEATDDTVTPAPAAP